MPRPAQSSSSRRARSVSSARKAAVAALACSMLAACATNPATGRREFMLVSEAQEIAMGQSYDPQIVASIGLYPDTALQRYVQDLGTRIAALSERPKLNWTFRVLDDPQVNAFAVPGGYIYITRGILAHLDNEAQLAAVIGHEIAHVTARHSASQMSKQQLAQLGLVVGSVASETFAQYAELAGQGVGALFLKYSRDDETEADALGLRYMRRSNHDIREMPDVFTMLGAVTAAATGGEGSKVPAWMMTHPLPEDRFARISRAIAAQPQDSTGAIMERTKYTRLLNNVVYGEDPRQGFFRGTRFMHPTMKFEITFPTGWQTKNEASAVVAMSATNDGAIQLTLANAPTADSAMRAFTAQQGLQVGQTQRANTNGLSTNTTPFAAATEGDTLRGNVLFVEHQKMVFQVLGYAPQAKWTTHQPVIDRTLKSFAVLTDATALAVQPQRLSVITLDRASSIAELKARRASPLTVEQLALINQVRTGEVLPVGRTVKWVTATAPPRP